MSDLSQIQLPVQEELDRFKKLFDHELQSENALLNQVMEYVKQRQGKMMRPILVMLIAKLLNKNVDDHTLYGALALELLHTASLMHDDVVDESNERRGQRSVNASFDNKLAVLSGDYVFAVCLTEIAKIKNLAVLEVIAELGQKLASGEILQLSSVSKEEVDEAVYMKVIEQKTATLFAACAKIAALSVGVSDELVDHFALFGLYLGICFQIKDDIFDYYSDNRIGKPTGNDMKEGKLTLPFIYAFREHGTPETAELMAKVKRGEASEEEIETLILFARNNGGIEYANKVMSDYKEKALALLNRFEASPIKNALQAYLDLVVGRMK